MSVQEGHMSRVTNAGLFLAVVLLAAAASAGAEPLSIVTLEAPGVDCVFHGRCRAPFSTHVGDIALPELHGRAQLETRTFTGAPGTAGAGKTAYLYRVNLRQATGAVECLAGMVINFGPVMPLSYRPGALSHVFVLRSSGGGTIGLKSAEKDG